MKLELKNIKHSAFASEETECYKASLYFNGKKVGFVSNGGKGGCDHEDIEDKVRWDEMEKCIAKLPPMKYHGTMLTQNLETLCGDLLNAHFHKQELKKLLRKGAVILIGKGEARTTSYRGKKKPDAALYAEVQRENPDAVVLNTLDFDAALKLYVANAAT